MYFERMCVRSPVEAKPLGELTARRWESGAKLSPRRAAKPGAAAVSSAGTEASLTSNGPCRYRSGRASERNADLNPNS